MSYVTADQIGRTDSRLWAQVETDEIKIVDVTGVPVLGFDAIAFARGDNASEGMLPFYRETTDSQDKKYRETGWYSRGYRFIILDKDSRLTLKIDQDARVVAIRTSMARYRKIEGQMAWHRSLNSTKSAEYQHCIGELVMIRNEFADHLDLLLNLIDGEKKT